MDREPLLRKLFPGKSLHCAIEELAAFLVQFPGGPGEQSQRRRWLSLRDSHARFRIGPAERDAWLANMAVALTETGIEEPLRTGLFHYFKRTFAHFIKDGETAPRPPNDGALARREAIFSHLESVTAAIKAANM